MAAEAPSSPERLERILGATRNGNFELAQALAEDVLYGHDSIAPASGIAFTRAFFLFWLDYSRAQREWYVSYNYADIRNRFNSAKQQFAVVANTAYASATERVQHGLKDACCAIADAQIAALDIENAEVGSDSQTMFEAAEAACSWTVSGLSAFESVGESTADPELLGLARIVLERLNGYLIYYTALRRYAETLSLQDRLDGRAMFLACVPIACSELEVARDQLRARLVWNEPATHLGVCIRFLQRQAELSRTTRGRLYLSGATIVNSISWTDDDALVSTFMHRITEHGARENQHELTTLLPDWVKDPPRSYPARDMYRTHGSQPDEYSEFAPVIINCGTIDITLFRKKKEHVDVSLELYRFGVCSVVFEFLFDEISAQHARQVQALMSAHPGEHAIEWTGWPGHTFHSLPELARCIKDRFTPALKADELEDTSPAAHVPWNYLPHLAWFSCLESKQWTLRDESGHLLIEDYRDLLSEDVVHPDLKALLLPAREARATVDDWAAAELPLPIKNRALVRSHPCDLMNVTPNHAVLFYPDDPYYLVTEFTETVQLASRLRCLAVSVSKRIDDETAALLQGRAPATPQSKRTSHARRDPSAETLELENWRLWMSDLRSRSALAVEKLSLATTSQYGDHTDQAHQIIEDLGVPAMLDDIERKLKIVQAHVDLDYATRTLNVAEHHRNLFDPLLLLVGLSGAFPVLDTIAKWGFHAGTFPQLDALWTSLFGDTRSMEPSASMLAAGVWLVGVVVVWLRFRPREPARLTRARGGAGGSVAESTRADPRRTRQARIPDRPTRSPARSQRAAGDPARAGRPPDAEW